MQHNFHPSGTLHHKNSMSLGQYETTKVYSFLIIFFAFLSFITMLEFVFIDP